MSMVLEDTRFVLDKQREVLLHGNGRLIPL
jgi:hypothetical protein